MKNSFSNLIINWFNLNKRFLPWRQIIDPFFIWLSEIILQQTRVNQGMDYYNRFAARFPDVKSLAEASEDEVLKLWQGLGYYSRARNLHTAAKQIVNNFSGIFPKTYDDILSLKGVGEYTAAAIASICYKLPYPVVDGNVFRVLSRVFGIDVPINTSQAKKIFYEKANELIDRQRPDLFNQAVMEFGALYCVPQKPDCSNCIFRSNCFAYINNMVNELPVKKNNTIVKKRFFYFLIIHFDLYIYICKRSENDIWKNLYQFPLIESNDNIDVEQIFTSKEWCEIIGENEIILQKISSQIKHQLTHQQIFARFIHIQVDEKFIPKENWLMIKNDEFANFAIPRIIDRYLNN